MGAFDTGNLDCRGARRRLSVGRGSPSSQPGRRNRRRRAPNTLWSGRDPWSHLLIRLGARGGGRTFADIHTALVGGQVELAATPELSLIAVVTHESSVGFLARQLAAAGLRSWPMPWLLLEGGYGLTFSGPNEPERGAWSAAEAQVPWAEDPGRLSVFLGGRPTGVLEVGLRAGWRSGLDARDRDREAGMRFVR